ncbi:MAG: IS110 family transposase [Verrucomicrobiota bacterium]
MKTTIEPTNPPSFFLGIDVGKAELFCHLIGPQETCSESFANSAAGIRLLTKWLAKTAPGKQLRACLEQTGRYGDAVVAALYQKHPDGIHLVNPHRIKAFGMQKLRRNKSDTADAKLIARFLKSEHLELLPWHPRSLDQQRITELSRYADSLTQDTARLKTKLEAQPEKSITISINRRIRMQEKELAGTRASISKLIKANPELLAKSKLLKSIPGLGEVSTQIVIAELPDLGEFTDARKLAAWAGLTPQHYDSGTSGRTRTPITKIGSVHLRRGLFMPAMTARVFNPLLKTFAERLKENGKKPKQIIIAVMRKLLHQIYGILKSDQPYNPEKRGFAGS